MNRVLLVSVATGALLSSCARVSEPSAASRAESPPANSSTMKLKSNAASGTPDDSGGTIHINTIVEPETVCPAESNITALPRETQVGRDIELEGFGSEDGDSVEWSAATGAFEDDRATATKYACTEPGTHDVTFAILRDGCEDTVATVQLRCTKNPD